MPFPDPRPGYRTQYPARSDARRPLPRPYRLLVLAALLGLLALAAYHGWLAMANS